MVNFVCTKIQFKIPAASVIIVVVLSESKPHQDVLNKDNIKIEAITEVKGVQGNWKLDQLVVFFS